MGERARGSLYVLAAALAAHLASLRAGWVLDDWELLVDNPYLRSTRGLGAVLTKELFIASGDPRHFPYYRPLSGLVYWLTYQLFDANALVQHAFNVALHGACAVLFFHLAQRLKVSTRAALVMGLVFAVHPVSVEVVAYAGGRQDVLGRVVTFATMLLLLRPPRSPVRLAVLAFAGTVLAAFAREEFLAAPALFVVAAHAFEAKPARPALAAATGGAIAIALLLLLRRALAITPFGAAPSPSQLIGAVAAVLLRFVKDVLAPTDLAADVTIFPLSLGLGLLVGAGAAGAFALGYVAVKRRASPARAAFVLGGVSLAVIVVLNAVVAVRFGIVSDRYAYGAVAALLLLASPAIEAVVARAFATKKQTLFAFAVTALVVAVIPLTWARAADYKNDTTLAMAMVRERPDDPRALLSQIFTLRAAGQMRDAYPLCHRYAEQLPTDIVVSSCLAEEAFEANDDARALSLLDPWLAAQPTDERARALYFRALFRRGDREGVQRALDRFEPLAPNAPDIRAAREALRAAPSP